MSGFLNILMANNASAGSTPATWNPADADGDLQFSNGNLTVNKPNVNTWGSVRSNVALGATDKIYFRTLVEDNADHFVFHLSLGIANLTFGLTGFRPGEEANPSDAIAIDIVNGNVYKNGALLSALVTSGGIGDSFDIAIDMNVSGVPTFWARKVGLGWCDQLGGTQNPATGAGGIPFNDIHSGPYCALSGMWDGKLTTDFSSLTGAPSGFTALAG